MEDKQQIFEVKLSKTGNDFLKFFMRYLKERHSFALFQKAFFRQNGYRSNNLLKDMCEYCNNSIINHAFTWAETQEGHNYWKKLNYDFLTLSKLKTYRGNYLRIKEGDILQI